jgi:hypothetical protein
MAKPIVLTAHAAMRIQERAISEEWIEATVRAPTWTENDPLDRQVERRFRSIPEARHRILRIACVETKFEIRVVSVMFDRRARPKS